MGHSVAQHVFQRCGHALQHVAVKFALGALELELGLLAGVAGRLSDHPAQTRHQRIERQHARAHQAFLQLGTHPRLLQQQGFVLAGQVVHRAMQAHQVGRGFRQRARELLQGAEAVEFQRVEVGVAGVVFALVARDDLRFSFRIQAAQLVAQADVGLFHFRGGAAERAELLFQAGAVGRDLACVVHQAVQQVGTNAHLLLRGADADVVIVDGTVAHHRRRQRLQFDPLHRRVGEGEAVVDRVRHHRQRGFGARGEVFDQTGRHPHRTASGNPGDHPVQAVEPALQQRHAVLAEFRALRDHGFQQGFHGVA